MTTTRRVVGYEPSFRGRRRLAGLSVRRGDRRQRWDFGAYESERVQGGGSLADNRHEMGRGKRNAMTAYRAGNLALSDAGRHKLDPSPRQLAELRERLERACARFELTPWARSVADRFAQRLGRWPDRSELVEITAELERALTPAQFGALLTRYCDYIYGHYARPEIVHFFPDGFTIERVANSKDLRDFATLTMYDDAFADAEVDHVYMLRRPTGEPDLLLVISRYDGTPPFTGTWIVEGVSYRWDPNVDDDRIVVDYEAVGAATAHIPDWIDAVEATGVHVVTLDDQPVGRGRDFKLGPEYDF
jgi:hypothetical protein